MSHKLVGYIILAVFLCSIVFLRQYTYLQLTTREPTNQMSIRTIEADFVNTTTEWPERDLLGDSVQESAADVPDAQLEKLPTMQRKQQPPPKWERQKHHH